MSGADSEQKKKVEDRFHELRKRFNMPPDLARAVARGDEKLSEALKSMQLRERLARFVEEGKLAAQDARRVELGKEDLDHALFRVRLRSLKRADGYMRSKISKMATIDPMVHLALVGGQMKRGRLVDVSDFQLVLESPEGSSEVIEKHDLKFVFNSDDRKKLLRRGIARGEEVLEAGALKSMGSRKDIKARVLLRCQEEERVITWTTVEGDQLRGRVLSFGRWEVALETTHGPRVILLRHAYREMS